MRIEKKFGVRTTKLQDSEVKRKFLLVCEGEKTEILYFEGINQNRKYLNINPLIEIKPILRSFDEKGWSNPKKLLDRLLEYKSELTDDIFTIKSIIAKTIDFLLLDNIINSESIYSCQDIQEKIEEYLKIEKNIEDFEKETEIEEITQSIIDCLIKITDLSIIIPKFEKYINSQNIVFDKEIDKICLIVDRDKESFISNPVNDQYHYVLNKCKENDIDFYITNPCFEFWLLLHFDEINSLDKDLLLENPKITSKKRYAETELNKLVPGYQKNDIKFNCFLNRIDKAITNQKNFCEDVNDLKDMIGSNFATLICKLREK